MNDYQQRAIEFAKKGYAVEANRRHFTANQWADRMDLVSRGLLRITRVTGWSRHGAFVLPDKEETPCGTE